MICIDSDCIIDFLRGKVEAIKIIESYKEVLATTEVNVFEVFFGIYNIKNISEEEEKSASLFFANIPILSSDCGWGKKAAKLFSELIRDGKIIEQDDCIIASIMIKNDCNKIITNNKKHFTKIDNIEVIQYQNIVVLHAAPKICIVIILLRMLKIIIKEMID